MRLIREQVEHGFTGVEAIGELGVEALQPGDHALPEV